MSQKIGNLWEDGEDLIGNGAYHDGLLHFQRAKALLIAESSSIYDDPSKNVKASKIFGEIMQKLTHSIEKNVKVLNENPIIALGLKRGYNKSDVKKAYRKNALKFHPDKNQVSTRIIPFTPCPP